MLKAQRKLHVFFLYIKLSLFSADISGLMNIFQLKCDDARLDIRAMAPRITRYSQFASEQKIPNLPELKKEDEKNNILNWKSFGILFLLKQ